GRPTGHDPAGTGGPAALGPLRKPWPARAWPGGERGAAAATRRRAGRAGDRPWAAETGGAVPKPGGSRGGKRGGNRSGNPATGTGPGGTSSARRQMGREAPRPGGTYRRWLRTKRSGVRIPPGIPDRGAPPVGGAFAVSGAVPGAVFALERNSGG